MTTCTFTEALQEVSAVAHAKVPETWHSRLEMATALVSHGAVFAEDDGIHVSVRSRSNPEHWWPVNGACACEDAQLRAPKGHCAHRLAAILYLRASERMLEPVDEGVPLQDATETLREDMPPTTTEAEEVPETIPAKWIAMIQGKPFVKYEGLLAMAHAHGLTSLAAKVEWHSELLVLASATAVFADGQTFTEWGDATPTNVTPKIAPHFPRMALTRAKARALRDALNIGICAVEELT